MLLEGPVRIATIRKTLGGISKKVLLENLNQLESVGVVERQDLTNRCALPHRIPYIEYRLTDPAGKSLAELALALQRWRP